MKPPLQDQIDRIEKQLRRIDARLLAMDEERETDKAEHAATFAIHEAKIEQRMSPDYEKVVRQGAGRPRGWRRK